MLYQLWAKGGNERAEEEGRREVGGGTSAERKEGSEGKTKRRRGN
jgi:hypothetical protein